MLVHLSHVAHVAVLALALLFPASAELSRRGSSAPGNVHIRDELYVEYLKAPTLQISEQELRNLLGIKQEFDLTLDIDMQGLRGIADAAQSVGRIPVHIKIHELTIGGILAPSLEVEDVALQADPINYGNIRVI